ncbi:MAG: hypothetical protein D084_Lepto4C00430G0006 [Leptospirillum sp. Group IV 'UBA BS']|jgi:glutaredoxin|uniref:Thioredoxin domain-containing protein n=1 Tax=Leptospirillum ferriphilum TaxID=178606 RepID=A0A2I2MH22_9BACT|nr:thioredoxin family protein [Leptospirillum ferriphilum]EQD24480.1 MAG: hypothetical protein D084_Lepto4C00430G0006 [Leptospirillum sp. Group IV 'UBA BS']
MVAKTTKRKIEVFSAGCPVCTEAADRVRSLSCPSCELTVLDMKDTGVAKRARELGVRSLPSVAIDGQLAGCCSGRGIDKAILEAGGLGQP